MEHRDKVRASVVSELAHRKKDNCSASVHVDQKWAFYEC
jgi:hypothetical protein